MTVVRTISPRSSARLASRCFWSSQRQYITNSTVDRWASSMSDVFLFFWTGGHNKKMTKGIRKKKHLTISDSQCNRVRMVAADLTRQRQHKWRRRGV
jgi:hypothetical protein